MTECKKKGVKRFSWRIKLCKKNDWLQWGEKRYPREINEHVGKQRKGETYRWIMRQ